MRDCVDIGDLLIEEQEQAEKCGLSVAGLVGGEYRRAGSRVEKKERVHVNSYLIGSMEDFALETEEGSRAFRAVLGDFVPL